MNFEQSIEPLKKSKELIEAEKRDAELAKSLSPEEKFDYPGPATVSEEVAEENLAILESRLAEQTKKLGQLIEFPGNKKPKKPEGPGEKKAA